MPLFSQNWPKWRPKGKTMLCSLGPLEWFTLLPISHWLRILLCYNPVKNILSQWVGAQLFIVSRISHWITDRIALIVVEQITSTNIVIVHGWSQKFEESMALLKIASSDVIGFDFTRGRNGNPASLPVSQFFNIVPAWKKRSHSNKLSYSMI